MHAHGELPLPVSLGAELGNRGAMMPRRTGTGADERRCRIIAERNKNQRSNARDGSVHRVKFVELLRQVLDEVPDVGHHFRCGLPSADAD
jgi:hypothetical protein